jgi:hypothetical protein
MKKELISILFVGLLSNIVFGQEKETFHVRLAPQVSFDLANSKTAKLDIGTNISFIVSDSYKESGIFLLEVGYSLKSLSYGDTKNGATQRIHGLQITPAFEFGKDWFFTIGPYMNIIMGSQNTLTLNSQKRDFTSTEVNLQGLRNVDLGSTIRIGRNIANTTRIELGLDNTLVNLIERGTTKYYPATLWLGLRFKISK